MSQTGPEMSQTGDDFILHPGAIVPRASIRNYTRVNTRPHY